MRLSSRILRRWKEMQMQMEGDADDVQHSFAFELYIKLFQRRPVQFYL